MGYAKQTISKKITTRRVANANTQKVRRKKRK